MYTASVLYAQPQVLISDFTQEYTSPSGKVISLMEQCYTVSVCFKTKQKKKDAAPTIVQISSSIKYFACSKLYLQINFRI